MMCRPSHEPHDRPASSEHSKVASGSFEPNWKVAVELTIVPSGPDSMVVSGTTEAVPVTTAKAEKLSTWPQTCEPVLVSVTSCQAPPSWWSSRTGSATPEEETQTVTGPENKAVVWMS
jgi:hypothetical protein